MGPILRRQGQRRIPGLATTAPDALPPINLTNLFMASPTQWKKLFDAVPASVTDPKERAKRA